MNKTQFHILTQLIRAPNGLRYTQMKPDDLENDLFNYHLKQLVKKKTIKKEGTKYNLTHLGKQLITNEKPISSSGDYADLFKICVLTLVVGKNKKKIKVLNQLRKRQPYYGVEEISGGSIKKGESILEAATRKLKQKTDLDANFKSIIGIIRNTHLYKDGVFQDIFYFICATDKVSGDLAAKTDIGTNKWIDLDTAIKNERESKTPMPKLIEILEQLKEKDFAEIPFFYVEQKSTLNKI